VAPAGAAVAAKAEAAAVVQGDPVVRAALAAVGVDRKADPVAAKAAAARRAVVVRVAVEDLVAVKAAVAAGAIDSSSEK
jgi:hypothetical protein